MNAAVKELEDFRREVAAWLDTNKPPTPDFLLPQSFMEVGSEQQLDFLREWQHKVWSAGYLGMAWPKEYGGQGVDAIYCMSVNDSFVMNKWAQAQELENVKVIPDGSGEFTRKVGMLVDKDNLGFGMRSWRYAAVINDGVIEAWFEEPGRADNHPEDPYGESSPETVLAYLRNPQATEVAAE